MSDFTPTPPDDGFELDPEDFEKLVNGAMGGADEGAPAAEADAGELAGKWQVETLADAYADTAPVEFLIDGLLPVPSLTIVYGGPGSLKSMILVDMALCVAGGVPWLEMLPNGEQTPPGATFTTKQAPVLWVDFDNGPRRTRERIGAIGRGHNLPTDTPMRYISMPSPWMDASDRKHIGEVAKFVQFHGFRLVVIDNLGLINGGIEENSGEMAMVMGHLRWLAESAGCAVIVVHHQRKSSGMTAGVRKGETLRGHSTIEASLDLALLVERNGREDAIVVSPTKVRDYQDFDSFGAIWSFEHKDGTRQMQWGRFWSRAVATGEEAVNLAIIATIKSELRGKGWMAPGDIVKLVQQRMAAKPGGKAPGVHKVRGLLHEMAENGHIVAQGSNKYLVYSTL